MDIDNCKKIIDDAFAKETGKRRVGRPYKSEAEKKQNRKEYNAKYWAEHKEEISRKRKKYYQENKDKINARSKRWFESNRERWNKYQRERSKKNMT